MIRGSNTVGEELLPHLITEYKKEHPNAAFDLEFKGTSYGLGAVMAGQCDIAAASRETTMNELGLARDRSIDLNDYVIGSYSVAIIVNSNNTVTNLTLDQVRDVFTGAVQNWKEIGGKDSAIHLYIRDPISGTYLGFQDLAMEKKPYGAHLKAFNNYGDIAKAVAQDAEGIGYTGLDLGHNAGVKALSVNRVPATPFFVNKGQYPYARILRLYTDKSKEKPAARDFIQFAESATGQKILADMGFVPRP